MNKADAHAEVADAQVTEALRVSEEEAVKQESADVAEALWRSEADSRMLSGDEVVVLRVTRRAADVVAALLEAPARAGVRARVTEAGCDMLPDWASSAVLFIPLTPGQVLEAGVELRAHNIVALKSDQELITEAVSSLPKRRRPKIKVAHGTDAWLSAA